MRIDIGQLEFIDSKLRNICTELERDTGLEFTITSIYRIGDPRNHGQLPVRAIDLRMRNKLIGQEVVNYVNSNWQYDFERSSKPCAIIHGKGSNQHIHIQTHPNTRDK